MPVVFYDLETTGLLRDNPSIVQIGAVLENDENKTFNQYIRPLDGVSMTRGATGVHGITYENGVLRNRSGEQLDAVSQREGLMR